MGRSSHLGSQYHLAEQLPIVTLELPQDHENIRGPQSFH